MGNQSDLQSQVRRFRLRAEKAEAELGGAQSTISVLRQQYTNELVQHQQAIQQLQQARIIAMALSAQVGPTTVPVTVLERIDAGEITGVDIQRDDAADTLTISPLFAASPEEDEEGEEE